MTTYDAKKAEKFWTQRVKGTNELAAVLSYSLPAFVNEAYSQWEIDMVLKSLPRLKGRTVLDLACGIGRVTLPLAQRGGVVIAADNSEEMLRRCRLNIAKVGLSRRVHYRKLNATSLSFPNSSFDVVTCLGLLEHLPAAEQKSVVGEIARVTKPAGIAIFVINNAESIFLQRERRYNAATQHKDGYVCRFVDKHAVELILRKHGFVLQYKGSNCFQSVAKHSLRGCFGDKKYDGLFRKFFTLCADVDAKVAESVDFNSGVADQFILRAEKSCKQ
jgi:ubiquinone/menaquinone biosynthesis C-methylase UbiE